MNTLRLERVVWWGIAFILVLTPFLVSDHFIFPYVTTKAFFFRFMVEILAVLWGILLIKKHSFLPSSSRILWALIAFTVLLLFASLLGVDIETSLWSNFERMEGWIHSLHLLLFFVITVSVMRSKEDWIKLFSLSVAAAVFVALYALLEWGGVFPLTNEDGRVGALFGTPVYLSSYLLIHLFLCLYVAREKWIHTRAYLLTAPLSFLFGLVIFLTETRGAIIALAASVVVGCGLFLFSDASLKRKRIAGGVVFLLFVLSLAFTFSLSSFEDRGGVFGRLANISLEDYTTMTRLVLWDMALEGFVDRPLLGWGPGNFIHVFEEKYTPQLFSQQPWFDRAHNSLLNILVTGGIVGGVLYLSLFFFSVRSLWGNLPWSPRIIFITLLVAYFIHNFFVFDHLMGSILFIAVLGFAYFLEVQNSSEKRGVTRRFQRSVAVGVMLVATLLFVSTFRAAAQSYHIFHFQKDTFEGRVTEALAHSEKASLLGAVGEKELAESSLQTALFLDSRQVEDSMLLAAYYESGLAALKKFQAQSAYDLRALSFLASFENAFNNTQESREYAKKGLLRNSKRQHLYLTIADSYLREGNEEEAFKWTKRAYDIDTSHFHLRNRFIAAALRANRDKEVREILMQEYDTLTPRNFDIFQGYGDSGNIVAVEDILKKVFEDSASKDEIVPYLGELVRWGEIDIFKEYLAHSFTKGIFTWEEYVELKRSGNEF